MHKKPSQHKKTAARIRSGTSASYVKPSSVGELLVKRPLFQALANASGPQEEWARWLAGTLPEELASHLVSVVIKPSELVVFADAAVWSSRLRYALASIQPQIGARDPAIVRTQVRVMPRTGQARRREPV